MMNYTRFTTLQVMILAAAATRLLPHPDNVAPIAAMALFAAVHIERKWLAFAMPLSALLVSDAVLGFYSHMWVVYAAFALICLLGFTLRGNITPARVLGTTLASSVVFFLVTNCALLMDGTLYPHTLEGVVASYVAGIPFFRNTMLGDLFFSAILFGGFALMQRRFSVLRVGS